MPIIEIAKILVRRGQENQTGIPQLDSGEFGWAEDTEHLYIGKRVSDGATNDANTRILTEQDYTSFFTLLQGLNTGTAASVYQYRHDAADPSIDGTNYIASTVTSIQAKLDTLDPSVVDFAVDGVLAYGDGLGPALVNAINNLYKNTHPGKLQEARRRLLIPAGQFTITNTINLPPYTTLVGAGTGITVIEFQGGGNMFQTEDFSGNHTPGTMQSGGNSAQNVSISNMTLQYNSATTVLSQPSALIALNNVLNTNITNVEFKGWDYGMNPTAYAAGITMTSYNDGLTDGVLTENIYVDNCRFEGLTVGIQATGTVARSVINNNLFSDLTQGIVLTTDSAVLPGPTNFDISQNRFQRIVEDAIHIGANPSDIQGNNISSENYFIEVGNGASYDDNVNAVGSPVISFLSPGNKTVNDTFNRRSVADHNVHSGNYDFYYNTLVAGHTTIQDGGIYTDTISANVPTPVAAIPLNGADQAARIQYQITNADSELSRKGELLVNISADGYTSISDYYNYSESVIQVATGLQPALESDYDIFVIPTTSTFVYNGTTSSLAIVQEPGSWYFTTDNTTGPFAGKSALISRIRTDNSGNYVIYTISDNPQFNYSPSVNSGTYSLLFGTPVVDFAVNTSTMANNYIVVECSTSTSAIAVTDSVIEYSVNLQT